MEKDISADLKVHKPLLALGADVTFTVTLPVTPISLSKLSYGAYRWIKTLQKENRLINIKGKDARAALSLTKDLPPFADELFFYSASLPEDADELKKKSGSAAEYRMTTSFEAFPSSGTISHMIHEHSVPQNIGDALVWIAPAFPEFFRCGIDLYEKAHFSSLLAATPQVRERISIEATKESAVISVSAERTRGWKLNPLSQGEVFLAVRDLVKEAIGSDLLEIYLKKVQ